MITPEDQDKVKDLTNSYWLEEVKTSGFRSIFSGKEIGHRIADYVDENTTAMLRSAFDTKDEVDAGGKARARSMGDIWLKSNGIYNPINVKAGEAGKNGQPNMVSLTKLLDALMAREIDSYYLLIVKMYLYNGNGKEASPTTAKVPDRIVPAVFFVDMLDYLDFVTFDSGPGQTMLKEKSFYEFVESGKEFKQLMLTEKVSKLIDLLEDGDARLIKNRRVKMERLRADFVKHSNNANTQIDQRNLRLG